MQITIEMIESKEFKIRPKGYDQQEVDEFLDAICDEMAAQQDQIQSLQQQLMSAQAKRPAPVAAPAAQPVVTADATNSLKEILEMAQKVKSETIAAAEKQGLLGDNILDSGFDFTLKSRRRRFVQRHSRRPTSS